MQAQITANGTTVAIDENRTTIHGDDIVRSTHVSPRAAEIYAVSEALRAMGWQVRLPSSQDGYRLPLIAPELGDKPGKPLDASHWRHRAAGLLATLGENQIHVDASGDLPIMVKLSGATAVKHWRHVSQLVEW